VEKIITCRTILWSANRGLGFYHIDVTPSVGSRFKNWDGFDNFGVFTIEERELTAKEII
jgi:hypothetical protein